MAIERNDIEDEIEPINIVVEDDESNIVQNTDGSVDIMLVEGGDGVKVPFDGNIADELEEDQLQAISNELMGYFEADLASRKDWVESYVKGLEVLGFEYEERTEPWDGACGAFSNILAEAAIRFQAECMAETFPAAGPVKTKILGELTPEKEDAALRVRTDMNYELTEVMVEYRPEHERMLFSLGLAGSAFKKVYYDPQLDRQTSLYVPAEDIIVPYGASNVEQAGRLTHVQRVTKNDFAYLKASGFYRNVDLPDPEPYHSDVEEKKAETEGYELTDDDRYAFLEMHVDMIIDGVDEDDEVVLAKPYVITLDKQSGEVLAIRRNWKQDDELKRKRQHFVHYVYVPGFGFYGLGLIHIIGGYAKAGTSLIRQLVDAGSLNNLPGGLKARGLRVNDGDDTPIAPGEFRDVDVPSGTIKENIMTLPYNEPSQTLLLLLEKITEEGRRLGAISDMNISDMSANAPVGTTLALLERTLKPMAAVQARAHYAMKQEFKLLKGLIRDHAPKEYGYVPDRAEPRAKQSDYDTVDVIPVSDPNSSTMAQRVVQYQTVFQMAQANPQIYDLPQLHRQMIEVLGIKNPDKLVPTEDDIKPIDPVSENMGVLVGKPIKAFIYQDHEAHIAAHQAFMQDPQIAAYIGQSPAAQQIMAALNAHIAEHIAFSYRKQMEDKLGASLPAPNEELPEEMEVELARVMAEAGRQLTTQKQQAAAAQQAQQQLQDPVYQQKERDLAVKEAEVQRKAAKDQMEDENAKEELRLKQAETLVDAITEIMRLQSQNEQGDKRIKLDAARTVIDALNRDFSNENTAGNRPQED